MDQFFTSAVILQYYISALKGSWEQPGASLSSHGNTEPTG